MTGRVVVLGSVNADLVLRCAALPLPGETVHGRDFRTLPGGKGANQAIAAARLGASVAFIGCVGDDDFGRTAQSVLAGEGIDTTHLHVVAGTATGVAMILVDDAGQNSIALAAGANAALTTDHVDAAAPLFAGAALFVCQLESPLDVVRHAIGRARAAGVPVLLNPAPAQALPAALLADVDVLVPNETEAALLAGSDLDAAAAAAHLRAMGPATVLLTLGADGLQIDADGLVQRVPAPATGPVVDTTGAGDTFIGAFAAARVEGASVAAAAAFAQKAAALSVTRAGAVGGMPYRHEVGNP
ncbi:ribokinase [Piscinibacter gummiphilus]|uniref:ribokinase n=1 Tax=Piscinibacter gummiphilus TaxID=946333 RepID=UPI001F02C5A6|nr:ribokinase [Piscinibacter gummiphilus]GLS96298.1 ribokinase [Piscinibacter gummiphilus]